jgi:hypothetical protein
LDTTFLSVASAVSGAQTHPNLAVHVVAGLENGLHVAASDDVQALAPTVISAIGRK